MYVDYHDTNLLVKILVDDGDLVRLVCGIPVARQGQDNVCQIQHETEVGVGTQVVNKPNPAEAVDKVLCFESQSEKPWRSSTLMSTWDNSADLRLIAIGVERLCGPGRMGTRR